MRSKAETSADPIYQSLTSAVLVSGASEGTLFVAGLAAAGVVEELDLDGVRRIRFDLGPEPTLSPAADPLPDDLRDALEAITRTSQRAH